MFDILTLLFGFRYSVSLGSLNFVPVIQQAGKTMKNVIILGASGGIASHVIDILVEKEDINLTLFLRSKSRLRNKNVKKSRIIEGNVLNDNQLKAALAGQDIVYANLAGALEEMAESIVKAMQETGASGDAVKRIIFISSIGIYESPVKSVLKPYRKAADVIEESDLEYTILRPAWFTSVDEVDFETTRKGEPERGSVISQRSLATFISEIIQSPDQYVRENLGINKPRS
jgi:uncharacterized protein YbjT (DUF2867 family)